MSLLLPNPQTVANPLAGGSEENWTLGIHGKRSGGPDASRQRKLRPEATYTVSSCKTQRIAESTPGRGDHRGRRRPLQ